MSPEQVKALIEAGLPNAEVAVAGGGGHYQLRVVSEEFSGLMTVKRQQKIYSFLNEHIARGDLHAVDEMKLYTPEEWHKASRLGLA